MQPAASQAQVACVQSLPTCLHIPISSVSCMLLQHLSRSKLLTAQPISQNAAEGMHITCMGHDVSKDSFGRLERHAEVQYEIIRLALSTSHCTLQGW